MQLTRFALFPKRCHTLHGRLLRSVPLLFFLSSRAEFLVQTKVTSSSDDASQGFSADNVKTGAYVP